MVERDEQRVFLFVGGPLDGQRRQVELSHGLPPSHYRCEQMAEPPVWCIRPAQAPSEMSRYNLYEYRLTHVADGDGRSIDLYVGKDVTDPFARLVAGYRPDVTLYSEDTEPTGNISTGRA